MTEGIVLNVQKFSLHDGPGIRTTVFLKGCPLRCPWCANPESQRPDIQTARDGTVYGRRATVEEIWREVAQDRPFYEESGGGMTLSGGEPLAQAEFALALLARCRAEGVHTAIETTGAATPEVFRRALGQADYVLFDIKHPDAARHRAVVKADAALVWQNLREAVASGVPLRVRIPVIPGFNDSLEDARAFAALLNSLGTRRVELLPFHQFGEKKYELLGLPYAYAGVAALHAEDMAAYRAALAEGGVESV